MGSCHLADRGLEGDFVRADDLEVGGGRAAVAGRPERHERDLAPAVLDLDEDDVGAGGAIGVGDGDGGGVDARLGVGVGWRLEGAGRAVAEVPGPTPARLPLDDTDVPEAALGVRARDILVVDEDHEVHPPGVEGPDRDFIGHPAVAAAGLVAQSLVVAEAVDAIELEDSAACYPQVGVEADALNLALAVAAVVEGQDGVGGDGVGEVDGLPAVADQAEGCAVVLVGHAQGSVLGGAAVGKEGLGREVQGRLGRLDAPDAGGETHRQRRLAEGRLGVGDHTQRRWLLDLDPHGGGPLATDSVADHEGGLPGAGLAVGVDGAR